MTSSEQASRNIEANEPDATLAWVCNAIGWVLNDPANVSGKDENGIYIVEQGIRFNSTGDDTVRGSYVGTGEIRHIKLDGSQLPSSESAMKNGDRLDEIDEGVYVQDYDRSGWGEYPDPDDPNHPMKDRVPLVAGTNQVDVERLRQRGPEVIGRIYSTIVSTLEHTYKNDNSKTF